MWSERFFCPKGCHLAITICSLRFKAKRFEALVISAPRKAYTPPELDQNKIWGTFIPLYALHSKNSWGGGDFSDLQKLSQWVSTLGGNLVATLPFFAAFLDQPFEPGPYTPASRLFWNEFYLDVREISELEQCPEAQELLDSTRFQTELAQLRSGFLVDYKRLMNLKRKVLEKLARQFFSTEIGQKEDFQNFVQAHPGVQDYASFRAALEQKRRPWPKWPERQREGLLKPEDFDEKVKEYHLYAQWLTSRQIQSAAKKSRDSGMGLYLDFPLGVHPHGYDVWQEKDIFVTEVSAGAPPDPFFTKGQYWRFPRFTQRKSGRKNTGTSGPVCTTSCNIQPS